MLGGWEARCHQPLKTSLLNTQLPRNMLSALLPAKLVLLTATRGSVSSRTRLQPFSQNIVYSKLLPTLVLPTKSEADWEWEWFDVSTDLSTGLMINRKGNVEYVLLDKGLHPSQAFPADSVTCGPPP